MREGGAFVKIGYIWEIKKSLINYSYKIFTINKYYPYNHFLSLKIKNIFKMKID